MTPTEKTIIDFCGHHADWWPSTTQVQEMLALAQPCSTCEALARAVMLDQTSHDTTPPQRPWVGLTDEEIDRAWRSVDYTVPYTQFRIDVAQAIEAKLKEKNA